MELQQHDILFLSLLISSIALLPPHKVNSVAKEDKKGLSAFKSCPLLFQHKFPGKTWRRISVKSAFNITATSNNLPGKD